MDSVLPQELNSGRAGQGRIERVVVAGARRHPLLELTPQGFVIAADGRPPLRGTVDIVEGGLRLARRLVVCVWAEGGRVGYEFKRGALDHQPPADYVLERGAPAR